MNSINKQDIIDIAKRLRGNLDKRKGLKMTVLFREGGTWHSEEVARIVSGLFTELQQLPAKPEYLILFGHHTKEAVLKAMWGGVAFTATLVTGIDSPDLPFRPHGWVI